MADSGGAKDGLDELVKSIIGSIQSVGATEQAIHQQTQTVLQATTQAVTDLVKNNAYSPELATENLNLQKAMINQTIEIINGLPTNLMDAPSKSNGKSGGKA
jgi:hypothetical protein